MKPHRVHFIVVLASVGLIAGCGFAPGTRQPPIDPQPDSGRHTEDGGYGLDAGLAPLEACALLNRARCEAMARCGLIDADDTALTACVRMWEATWCGPTTWPNHVSAGALRLDGARALACVNALNAQVCSDWPSLPDPCSRFLLPRATLGQPCFDGYDECLDGVCRGNACPRTCQARAVEGEACATSGECRAGLYCRVSSLTPTSGQCAAPSTIDALCFSDGDCAVGLACSKQVCTPLPQAGSTCLDGRCVESAYCETDSTGGMCTTRKAMGAPCVGGDCAAGLLCDGRSASCVPAVAALHESCSGAQQCAPGSTCASVDASGVGICATPAPEGAPCTTDVDCERHLACVSGDGGATCGRRLDGGAPCATTQQCFASAQCSTDGTCVELPLPGESCAGSRTCRWGLCRDVAGTDGGAVCGALLSAGAVCRVDGECASGSCREGRCLARCVP